MTKRTLLYETEIRSASREEDNNFTGEPSSPEQENYQLATCTQKVSIDKEVIEKSTTFKHHVMFASTFSNI